MFDRARLTVDKAHALVERCFAFLHQQCAADGKFSAARLDAHQLVCYDLACAVARLSAARALLDHAAQSGSVDEPIARLSLAYTAQSLQSVHNTLAPRPQAAGLDRAGLQAVFEQEPTDGFIRTHMDPLFLASLGADILERDGSLGASGLDGEKEMMRATFAQFADEIVTPLAESVHREDRLIPDEILAPLIDMGCFGLSVPARYGGLLPDEGEDSLGMIVVTEELSRGSLGAAGSLITRPEIMARALLRGGTEEQRARWLPRLAKGEPLCAIAITEPDYGSDVASIKLRAEPVDGGWRLNGNKTWCTFAGKAGVLLTLARSDPDPGLGHRGLSMFMVEKPSNEGYSFVVEQDGRGTLTGQAISTLGYRGMHSYDLFFDDYFVPEAELLGGSDGLGKGFYYTMFGFAGGRVQTAARATGLMQAAFDASVGWCQQRRVFGAPLGDYQLSQVKLALMAGELAAARQFTYSVGRLLDQGKGQMEASLVKLYSCQAAERVCRDAVQLHGGIGYAEETAVSRYFVDSKVLSIFEGAEETLALKVVARSLVEAAG